MQRSDALLEDAHDLPEVARLLEPEAHRISYDAPIHSVEDLDANPLPPRAVNIKPCRVGDVRSLLDVYAACEERGLPAYGGGMGELDVGRGQIQLLASLFHADGPNDVAPSGYNVDNAGADLPPSPLPAEPAPAGSAAGTRIGLMPSWRLRGPSSGSPAIAPSTRSTAARSASCSSPSSVPIRGRGWILDGARSAARTSTCSSRRGAATGHAGRRRVRIDVLPASRRMRA